MGWASGGRIFDRVARKLIEARVPDDAVTAVCVDLIEELTDGDWDTLDESIEQFEDHPAIMEAFRQAAPDWIDDEE